MSGGQSLRGRGSESAVGKPRAISASAHAGRCEGYGAAIALAEKILLVSPSLFFHRLTRLVSAGPGRRGQKNVGPKHPFESLPLSFAKR